ncbi:hypothetical protein WJX77_004585 [Trebouxia sp. C0004]
MACQVIFRLCPAAGTLTSKLQLQHELQGLDTSKRCFAAESDALFARELQTRIAAAEASAKPPRGSACQSQLAPRRHQSKWQRQHINHGRMTKLAVAAAAGAFVLGLAKQQVEPPVPESAVLQAQLCPEAILQQQAQQAFACPELHPGSLQICIQWLEDRKSLLKAEQSALRLLPPISYQPLREKEICNDLQSTDIIMSAVLATLKQEEMKGPKTCQH